MATSDREHLLNRFQQYVLMINLARKFVYIRDVYCPYVFQ
jgi:hypothetical protein